MRKKGIFSKNLIEVKTNYFAKIHQSPFDSLKNSIKNIKMKPPE
jgi:hypothetical protein